MFTISAVIPYCNNQRTVARTIYSLRQQTYPLSEILLINDGSSALPDWLIQQKDIRLISFTTTRGRGAVRAFAIQQTEADLILFCDANNVLPHQFASEAAKWFSHPQVAGVFGRICQDNAANVVDRWRARHLFKEHVPFSVSRQGLLATYGCLVRRSAVLEVGNFNPLLVHSEDADLGQRLLAKGFDVIFDPSLRAISTTSNTLPQVLERYWRWYAGDAETISLKYYVKMIYFALKVMVPMDLAEGDLLSVPISLLVPHYQFWTSWWSQHRPQKSAARK